MSDTNWHYKLTIIVITTIIVRFRHFPTYFEFIEGFVMALQMIYQCKCFFQKNMFKYKCRYYVYAGSCQFGCGILKRVGPKMQDFCPRINMLKGNFFKKILWWLTVFQKLGMILENNVVQKLEKNLPKNQHTQNLKEFFEFWELD